MLFIMEMYTNIRVIKGGLNMIWLGIGLCIIGLALLIISVVAIKPLKRLSDVLGSLKQTTNEFQKP